MPTPPECGGDWGNEEKGSACFCGDCITSIRFLTAILWSLSYAGGDVTLEMVFISGSVASSISRGLPHSGVQGVSRRGGENRNKTEDCREDSGNVPERHVLEGCKDRGWVDDAKGLQDRFLLNGSLLELVEAHFHTLDHLEGLRLRLDLLEAMRLTSGEKLSWDPESRSFRKVYSTFFTEP